MVLPYIDTHCHLDSVLQRLKLEHFSDLRQQHLPSEFGGCVTISCDPLAIKPTLALLEEENVYGAFGIHPHEAKTYSPEIEAEIERALKHPKCVAYGEIGLDYHYDFSPREEQCQVFASQIVLGVKSRKPLIIHTREAEEDTLKILGEYAPKNWPMHVHCFTSSADFAEQLLQAFPKLMIGFTGIVTFKNSDLVREAVRRVPLDRMLVETDAPYLAPTPFRGQIAHPGHIPLIVATLAALKERSLEETSQILYQNARAFYRI